MRILIVSNTPWNDNNSFGNSFSNIFGGNENYEIANIYCQNGLPDNKVVSRHFQISFSLILKSMFKRGAKSGREITTMATARAYKSNERKFLSLARILRWRIFYWMHDAVWTTGKWHSAELDNFIKDFAPDIIFQPVYFSTYIGEIALHAAKIANCPMVGYISDDCYTMRQFSLSPIFWIDRLIKRPYVRRVIEKCQLLYTITEKQGREYRDIFGCRCKVLFKGGDFTSEKPYTPGHPIKFIYTGSVDMGRWKPLSELAAAIKSLNASGRQAELQIYTASIITKKLDRALNVEGASQIMGAVPASQVKAVQAGADVLVHVESFDLSERYKSRLSFSTKIVDYLEAGRCILAIGWQESGGIEYLQQNCGAVVVTDKKAIKPTVERMLADKDQISHYAHKSFDLGRQNHSHELIRQRLYDDLKEIVENNNHTSQSR